MDGMERNFLRNQTGMRAQLVALDHLVQLLDQKLYAHLESADSTNLFFFRMLLVWYKWEFKWEDVLRLWETMWTNFLSCQFHLFIALAILERHRDVIMDRKLSVCYCNELCKFRVDLKQFDEVLKYINELSTTIEPSSTRVRAEALFYKFQQTVEVADRKSGFVAHG